MYSLCPTKERLARQPQPSGDTINTILVNMFQEAPNSYQEAMRLEDSEKWLATSQEEFDGLTEMGVWKLVDHPDNHKMQMDLHSQSRWQIQGEACCQGLYASSRDRL